MDLIHFLELWVGGVGMCRSWVVGLYASCGFDCVFVRW